MAARRLLIVMLVLLGLSTLAAALVPSRSTRDGTTATDGTGSASEEPEPTGERLPTVKIDAQPPVAEIPIAAGDQLPLTVTSRKSDLIEIPGLGLVEPVAPADPARFDLLIEEPGSYGVRLVTANRVIARIVVSDPAPSPRSRARAEPGPP